MNCWYCGAPGTWTYAAAGRMECGTCAVRWSVPAAVANPGLAAAFTTEAAW